MPPKTAKVEQITKPEVLIGEYDLADMTEDELQAFTLQLQKELEKSRDESKFSSIERDRVEHFWEITKKELEMTNIEIMSKDKEIEDLTCKYERLLKERDQKLKYFEYENTNKLNDKTMKFNREYKNIVDNLTDQRLRGLEKIQETDHELKKLQMSYENLMKETNQQSFEGMSEVTEYYETRLRNTIDQYEQLYDTIKHSANLQAKIEIHIMQSFKNSSLKDNKSNHIKGMSKMDAFFKDVTSKSFNLIDLLKSYVERLMKSEKEMKITLQKTRQENESLSHVTQDVKEVKLKLDQYQRDKQSFSLTRKRMLEYMQKIKDLESENNSVAENLATVSKQKENLNIQFVSSLRTIQERANLKNDVLEKKLEAVLDQLEAKEDKRIPSLRLPPAYLEECFELGSSSATTSTGQRTSQCISRPKYQMKVINMKLDTPGTH